MMKLTELTTTQLQRIIAIKEEIEALQSQINSLAGEAEIAAPAAGKVRRKRRLSRAGRARIAAAAKARWARLRGGPAADSKPARKRRKVSAEVRARLSASARARWKKAKAAGKSTL
jgi:hypothetical protein